MKPFRGLEEREPGSLSDPEMKRRYKMVSRILEARLHHGISQHELSRMADVPAAKIASIESGRLLPHAKTLRKLAEPLGIPYE